MHRLHNTTRRRIDKRQNSGKSRVPAIRVRDTATINAYNVLHRDLGFCACILLVLLVTVFASFLAFFNKAIISSRYFSNFTCFALIFKSRKVGAPHLPPLVFFAFFPFPTLLSMSSFFFPKSPASLKTIFLFFSSSAGLSSHNPAVNASKSSSDDSL